MKKQFFYLLFLSAFGFVDFGLSKHTANRCFNQYGKCRKKKITTNLKQVKRLRIIQPKMKTLKNQILPTERRI